MIDRSHNRCASIHKCSTHSNEWSLQSYYLCENVSTLIYRKIISSSGLRTRGHSSKRTPFLSRSFSPGVPHAARHGTPVIFCFAKKAPDRNLFVGVWPAIDVSYLRTESQLFFNGAPRVWAKIYIYYAQNTDETATRL